MGTGIASEAARTPCACNNDFNNAANKFALLQRQRGQWRYMYI